MTKPVKQTKLHSFAKRQYYKYGIAVLEDRAIPDYRDGFNPVNRRALWAAYGLGLMPTAKYVKSARVVGETLGKYHPHGDSAAYEAIVKMTNTNAIMPLMEGAGNWGSLSESTAAAMRYTEVRLSQFASKVVFDKFYTPTIEFVPNFDSSEIEPLVLPALLPIALINGRFGIAPGAQTHIPAFEFKTLLKLLKRVYSGEKLTAKMLSQTLKFTSLYGGAERKLTKTEGNAEARTDRLAVFKSTRGRVTLYANPQLDSKGKVVVTKFAGTRSMESMLTKLNNMNGVLRARDDSSKTDKYGKLTIELGRTAKREDMLARIDSELSDRASYTLNFTERYIDEHGQGAARVRAMSVLDMLTTWIAWRTELERKACAYWIEQAKKRLKHLELLMLAVDNRKLIIESLDLDLDQAGLEAWLAKKLNITPAEAHTIYSLKVIQLRKLERKTLEAEHATVEKERKTLEERKRNPEPHMAQQLDVFAKFGAGTGTGTGD